MAKKIIHFSGLNGIRAIAALAVVFAHTTERLDLFGLNNYIFGQYADGLPKTTFLAGFGVSMFFALSGFLITYLLLAEKAQGPIHIKNFYIRRVLRIWPLYYLYLLISIVTSIVFDLYQPVFSIFAYIFLAANVPLILGMQTMLLFHYWSLGVEEQFYSFWPWLVQKSRHLLKLAVIMLLGLLTLKTLARGYDIWYNGGEPGFLYNILHLTRFQCMLIGAVGAIYYFKAAPGFIKLCNNYLSQALAWLVIFLAAVNEFHIISFLDNEIISVVALVIIIGQIRKDKRIFNLEIPFFDFLGKISYGIYVFHPLVIFYLSLLWKNEMNPSIWSYLLVYFTVFLSTIFISWLSFNYYEKRFLRLKKKFTTIENRDTIKYPEPGVGIG